MNQKNRIKNIAKGMAIVFFISASSAIIAETFDRQGYLERFNTFTHLSAHLPRMPDQAFINFITPDKPLSNKLRERWLYLLASQKNWAYFKQYFTHSPDVTLQCFALRANYYQGNSQVAIDGAKSLWLSGESSSKACEPLFDLLLKNNQLDEKLISQRIALALEQNNVALARYLLHRYKNPRLKDSAWLTNIHHHPTEITKLPPGELHDVFYLYGLKRLSLINMDKAIQCWRNPRTKQLLSMAQQQFYIAHIALQKALAEHADADYWFSKIWPGYHSQKLLDWKIRVALKRQQWHEVERLIMLVQDKSNPMWQYWRARAFEKTNRHEKAHEIYANLAKMRHYYGFLASLRLHKSCSFQNKLPHNNKQILQPYYPFMAQVKHLYQTKQLLQASRLLNDFLLELPTEDKSALISWVAEDLHWHAKSVFLSNNDELTNHLSLRFPQPFDKAVVTHAKNYHIPTALIYAIIRQESSFRDDVISSAGACGLMQVMPATARVVAKSAKIAYTDKVQLFLSQKNINLGAAYLKYLSNHFSNNIILMAAAYNAGPRQVNYWLKHHTPKEMDIWIETLPWHETRNYLKNVVSFYAVYQYKMRLKSDLKDVMKAI